MTTHLDGNGGYVAELKEKLKQAERERDKWKRRAMLFRDAYNDSSHEAFALRLQKIQLEALGTDATLIKQRDALKAKLLSTSKARNEARAEVARVGEADATTFTIDPVICPNCRSGLTRVADKVLLVCIACGYMGDVWDSPSLDTIRPFKELAGRLQCQIIEQTERADRLEAALKATLPVLDHAVLAFDEDCNDGLVNDARAAIEQSRAALGEAK